MLKNNKKKDLNFQNSKRKSLILRLWLVVFVALITIIIVIIISITLCNN